MFALIAGAVGASGGRLHRSATSSVAAGALWLQQLLPVPPASLASADQRRPASLLLLLTGTVRELRTGAAVRRRQLLLQQRKQQAALANAAVDDALLPKVSGPAHTGYEPPECRRIKMGVIRPDSSAPPAAQGGLGLWPGFTPFGGVAIKAPVRLHRCCTLCRHHCRHTVPWPRCPGLPPGGTGGSAQCGQVGPVQPADPQEAGAGGCQGARWGPGGLARTSWGCRGACGSRV